MKIIFLIILAFGNRNQKMSSYLMLDSEKIISCVLLHSVFKYLDSTDTRLYGEKGKKAFWFKVFSFGYLSSQCPIFTPLLSSYRRLCWMRRMLFAGLFICQWAWHRNNYLSLWSITWLLTRDGAEWLRNKSLDPCFSRARGCCTVRIHKAPKQKS